MVSGKRFFPIFAGVVLLCALGFIALMVSQRDGRPPEEFIRQMDDAPRCALISGANSGVRRQSLTALLMNHPEWGIDVDRVKESYGPIDPVANLSLPGQPEATLVEVSFPIAGDPYGHDMDGVRLLCVEGVVKAAWPISHRVDRLVLKGKSAFQAPARVPRAGLPEAIPLRGNAAPPTALWLSRCAGTEGPDSRTRRCTLEAYSPEAETLLTTVGSYTGRVDEEDGAPVALLVTPTGGAVTGDEVTFSLDVALTLGRLSEACIEDHAFRLDDTEVVTPNKGCALEPVSLLAPCACGPVPVLPGASAPPFVCRPAEGFEAKLGDLCALITADAPVNALTLSRALPRGGE